MWQNLIPLADLKRPATEAAADVRERMNAIVSEVNALKTQFENDVRHALERRTRQPRKRTRRLRTPSRCLTTRAISAMTSMSTRGLRYRVYIKTDRILKPEAFTIYRVYKSISAMEADKSNARREVRHHQHGQRGGGGYRKAVSEDIDGLRLYRGRFRYERLHRKTPQFSIGTITAGTYPSVSLSDGARTHPATPYTG
ncbi:hypothetical protein [Parabacteroides distasonis]|uniref:hypothetical protein n=1 Tax=Parabacteroides distasonis TaxID=823 RepID=UPI0012497AD9|nr:hypothetical protein [Parabacteroides distasonis]